MSRNGDVNQPTREFPEYPTGTTPIGSEPATAAAEPPSGAVGSAEPPAGDPPASGGDERAGGGRRGPARGLLMVLGAAALVVVVLLGTQAAGLWPSWRNPFAQETTDRSQPPLLKSIRDLSRYVAAEGNFQVVVDLETDRKYVPDFLLNQRTLFVGAGRVEAYVDFSKIAEGAVVESADGKSVEITLPAPQLTDTNLDIEKSYVFAEKRGLLNRLGDVFADDPNRQREVYRLAEERITAAARDSELAARAEANTRKMLEGLLRSLGYQTVTVTYAAP